jgi:hypothetical protein
MGGALRNNFLSEKSVCPLFGIEDRFVWIYNDYRSKHLLEVVL